MVIQREYTRKIGGCFWCFAGASMFVVSIGLSIAISKTEDLSFGSQNNSFSLTKNAAKLSAEAEVLESLLAEILESKEKKISRSDVEKIKNNVKKSQQQIEEIIDNNMEEKSSNGDS